MENKLIIDESDGTLLKGLKGSLNNTIEKLKAMWKPSVFVRCFPTLFKHHESSLESIRKTILEALIEVLVSDLSEIISEELEEPLNKLSTLIENNSKGQKIRAWRPSGSPHEDLKAHDIKVLLYEKKFLEESLISHRRKRIELYELTMKGRNKCLENSLNIKELGKTLDNIENKIENLPSESMIKQMEKTIL